MNFNFNHDFSYLIRKHPFIRVICLVVICAVIVGFTKLISYSVIEKPVILSVSQQVGSPGDTITIRGKFFSQQKDSSFVEIAGNRLTGSSYVSWNDDEIVITIPANIQDGLLYVVTSAGRSNSDFFCNRDLIPISVPTNTISTKPVITSLSAETLYVGDILTISGKNFGPKKTSSQVYFSTKKTQQQLTESSLNAGNPMEDATEYIHASDIDYDYDTWSETEIKVYVPDGAFTGYVYVENENGTSSKHPLNVLQRSGQKNYGTKNSYLIQIAADVSDIRGTKDSVLTYRLPLPQTTSEQIKAELTETNPKPLLDNYDNTSVFQILMDKTGKNTYAASEKTRISQNHVITVRSVETWIDVDSVVIPKNRNRMLYKTYTRADKIVPADDPVLVEALPNIIYKSINPYRQAKLIYEYMIANYKIQNKLRKGDTSCLDMLKSKKGDAYDFAVLYCALLRTAGVPAKLMSGILIDKDKQAHPHWWVNFYLDSFGWVPADPALGAGLEYNGFQNHPNPAKYYFGNLDAQHIMFSQYWNNVKKAIANGKTVYIPKTYASQSIWEEASQDITSYSSFWNVPAVLGVY
ncbi:MAG: IPT/TIG domain-containing protein [Treponema sp.]|uniref:transglutaminase domain-containing protein n=1 Tax=Treponema sp. TaxID=166 RepID=UPI001B4D8B25|nr:transglutaminase domain-containing protein [Treponema sp.]MBP5402216.1 IPT/TIG domain-containing protein [Treponema sp.]MBR5933019.1 IPT/TIG domain-containing protein [Treponema sp.]